MSRSQEVVNLPSPERAPSGHRLYKAVARSECPRHAFCAYDGTEPDRCQFCHRSNDAGCDHAADGHGGRPGGTHACLCAPCGELFTGPTAFDKHIRGTVHLDPEAAKLELVERRGWFMWATPGKMPEDAFS